MGRYKLVKEDVINAYILDEKENRIVVLCTTKRPDLGFVKLEELIEKANKYELVTEQFQTEIKSWAYCEDCNYSTCETEDYGPMTMANLLELLSSKGGYIISDDEGGYYSQCPNCKGSNLVLESN